MYNKLSKNALDPFHLRYLKRINEGEVSSQWTKKIISFIQKTGQSKHLNTDTTTQKKRKTALN